MSLPKPAPDHAKTLGFVLEASATYLTKKNVLEARLDAEYLAARLLRCSRLDLPLKYQSALPEKYLAAMRRGVQRLGKGEPVQYVLGQWDFRKLTLKTDRRALIPRPETEELVQLLIDCRELQTLEQPRILDFGTGSGCIALSIASEWPCARVLGVDTSGDALVLAQENAERLGLAKRVSFLNLSAVDLADVLEPGSLDAIISNPPYIPTETCAELPSTVRSFEPLQALDGGPDGMVVIRHLIEDAMMLLASGGWVFLELSAEDNQAQTLTRYLSEIGFQNISVHHDASGKDRFLSGMLADGL